MIDILKKINFLITRKQRIGLLILMFLLFVGMILEIFGLGVLIPLISSLIDPEFTLKNTSFEFLTDIMPNVEYQSNVIFFLLMIVIVYLLKSIYLVFLTYKQDLYLNYLAAFISNNLFYSYMGQTYVFHLNKNVSSLNKNIQVEMTYFYLYLKSLIIVFVETALMISVLGFLIYLEPIGAFSIGLFYGLLSLTFFQFTKKKLKKWGILRERVDNQLSKIVLEGLGGIKDLKILGRENYFLNHFAVKIFSRAKLNSNQETFSQIPRFYLELISIIGLVCFIILLLYLGKDSNSLITVLGVFVAATFRLAPSINRIITAIQSMKFFTPSVELVVSELKNFKKTNQKLLTDKKFILQEKIEFKNVTFSHKERNYILKKVNIQIPKNKAVGIIGESGSGKSTLVDLIMGLQIPNEGEILIDNKSDIQISQNWRNNIGYVSQSIYLIDSSIKSNIAFGIPEELIDLKRIKEIVKKVRLEKLIGELKEGLDTNVGERGVQLSGGQRQRIGIARALYHNPDILIFDEATSALDTETEKEVMSSIYDLRKGKTIIIIAHRLSTLNKVDIIYKISNNKIKKV